MENWRWIAGAECLATPYHDARRNELARNPLIRRLKTMLAPRSSDDMTCWPVSPLLDDIMKNDASVIEPTGRRNWAPEHLSVLDRAKKGRWADRQCYPDRYP